MKAKKRVLIFLFLILLGGVAACLLTLPMFHTHYIQIENTDRRKEYTMQELENIVKGKSIFLADRQKIKMQIEKDPYLVYKTVRYKLPDTLIIRVEEREPKYYVFYMGSYVYMTYDGYVISAQTTKLNEQVPAINGMFVNHFNIREKISVSDEYQLAELTKIMEKISLVGLEKRISEIDISDSVNIKMKTNEGYEIFFGTSENAERKIEWIYAILGKLEAEAQYGKRYSIDVSVAETPTYKEIEQNQQ